jgi:excisionase family DNA binding protein
MRTDSRQVGDILVDAIAEAVAQRIGDRIDVVLERQGNPVPRVTLSMIEAAEALSVSLRTIERTIEAGQMRAITIGGRRLVPMDEVRRIGSHGALTDEDAS